MTTNTSSPLPTPLLPLSTHSHSLSPLQAFWSPLHQPGWPSLFQVRGPTYLADHVKVRAGPSAYTLLAVDLVSTPSAVHHLARFLPSVRWVGVYFARRKLRGQEGGGSSCQGLWRLHGGGKEPGGALAQ